MAWTFKDKSWARLRPSWRGGLWVLGWLFGYIWHPAVCVDRTVVLSQGRLQVLCVRDCDWLTTAECSVQYIQCENHKMKKPLNEKEVLKRYALIYG